MAYDEDSGDGTADGRPVVGVPKLKAQLGAWISTEESLPDDETPVLILFSCGGRRIGELRWERPTWEETFTAYRYWDDPENDGQDWDFGDVIGWHPILDAPKTLENL